MKRLFFAMLTSMLLAVSLVASFGARGLNDSKKLKIENQQVKIELQDKPFRLLVKNREGETLLELMKGPSFTTVRGQKDPFDKGKTEPWQSANLVVSSSQGADFIEWKMAGTPGGEPLIIMKAAIASDYSVRVTCEVLERTETNRLEMRFTASEDDRYFGMGERFDSAEHSGKGVYNWAEEQHIGTGALSWLRAKPIGGIKTYFPVPFYLNPARGYGLLLDDTHFSEFDFGKADPDTLSITNWNDRMDLMIFIGDDPLEIITNYTAFAGRIKPAPPWAFGVWNAAAQGQDRAYEVARVTRENQIPTSAIWSEDWDSENPVDNKEVSIALIRSERAAESAAEQMHKVNPDRYPDYKGLNEDLDKNGFRFLAYFKPYVRPGSVDFEQADQKGYLIKTEDGEPYLFVFPWLIGTEVGQVDLGSEEAREWWKEAYFQKTMDYGIDGWMHDFSEYTPADSVFSNGEDGWATHNAYPVMWAKLGREFWEQARPDGDWVFFMRAGYTGSWKYAPVMWTGDQNMDWERYDGIPSVIPAVNSVGISGSPVTATDIAGYMCIPLLSQPADKELFFRWTQLGAMLPVMRIHESSGCPMLKGIQHDNWLFDSDHETLMHWKKYAELHVALFPYFYTLVYEAAEKGWPVVRHLMLHYPDDPGSLSEDYEFMVGDRLLVAPVIKEGAREREVYFPPGEWISWWDGSRHQGPGRETVPAPLDTIPLFVRSGTMIPTFDSRIDTLVKEDREDLNGWDEANSSIKVLFFGQGEDELTLWDGTRIRCNSRERRCDFSESPTKRTESYVFIGDL